MIEYLSAQIENDTSDIRIAEDMFSMLLAKEDEITALAYNKKLLAYTTRQLKECHDDSFHVRILELRRKCFLFDAKTCFDSYLQYIEWNRTPDKRFYLPRRKILKPIVAEMQRLEDDELDLLGISLPPGVGKTALNIFFLTWIMGKYPNQPNLASAHSDKLTRSYYDGVVNILTDPDYLWSDVFPGIKIAATNAKDEAIDLDKVKRFKTLTCRSIGGSLTGATRCERILAADDLVSGVEESLSKERMDSLWDAYTNDLKTRKKEGCKEIHIATRWTIHDVLGRLERQYSDDPRARFIAVPALNEYEESNFDYVGGVGFSTAYFLDMKESLDDVSWRCLYQQEPIEREGLLYTEDSLHRYFELPTDEPDAIYGVCDTKDKGADYCFLPVVYQYGNDYYTEDCICDNALPEFVEPRLVEILIRHKVKACRFESNSAGGRIADKIQGEVKSRGGITQITTKFTTSNKETRIIVNSSWIKEHCLFKDMSRYQKGSDYSRMMNFLCSWTMGKGNKFDDVPDGMAQFAEFVQSFSMQVGGILRR